MYFLVAHLTALLEALARVARGATPPQLRTPTDLLRVLLNDAHCFHFAAIAVEVAATDMHHQGTGAVRLLRDGLLRHAPPELAPMAATRLDLLSGYAQSRVLHSPAAAYYHFYYGYIGWYLPRYGHRREQAALAAMPVAAGRYVAAAIYQGQPLQPAQPAQRRGNHWRATAARAM